MLNCSRVQARQGVAAIHEGLVPATPRNPWAPGPRSCALLFDGGSTRLHFGAQALPVTAQDFGHVRQRLAPTSGLPGTTCAEPTGPHRPLAVQRMWRPLREHRCGRLCRPRRHFPNRGSSTADLFLYGVDERLCLSLSVEPRYELDRESVVCKDPGVMSVERFNTPPASEHGFDGPVQFQLAPKTLTCGP